MTETEVQEGILKVRNAAESTLWLKRTIEDIETQESSYVLSRYIGKKEKLQDVHVQTKQCFPYTYRFFFILFSARTMLQYCYNAVMTQST